MPDHRVCLTKWDEVEAARRYGFELINLHLMNESRCVASILNLDFEVMVTNIECY